MSDFNWFCKFPLLILAFCVTGCLSGGGQSYPLKSGLYSVCFEEDSAGEEYGKYLYYHLSRRCREEGVVSLQNSGKKYKVIRVEVNGSLEYDYCLDNTGGELTLRAKDGKIATWLVYQFISLLCGEDDRFDGRDIPPAVITFDTGCRNFDFAYREPFFSPNLADGDYPGIIGTNTVETDWGIWGHNLGRVLEGGGSSGIYARYKNGAVNMEQYCFSNEETYNRIAKYIIDNHGYSPMVRFMILPNDNNISCTCALCVANGNSAKTATPSVAGLMKRLAEEFPEHMFFTTAYMTTQTPPSGKLPDNTGVMLSTIDIPKGVALNSGSAKELICGVEQWRKVTPNIYIWDYAANFDDYLTPVPVLYGLRKQLGFYKNIGVRGVFLNASGYDYSPFDDIKTYVAASLMADTSLSVDTLCRRYLRQYYPLSGELLENYYLSLEKRLESRSEPYNIYGSFREMRNLFLDGDEFMEFYNALDSLAATAVGEEKQKLQKLYTALSYTRLQLAYTQGCGRYGFAVADGKLMLPAPGIEYILERLLEHERYSNLTRYKESGGALRAYLRNWEDILERMPFSNYLTGESLEVLSRQDDEFTRYAGMLNDGVTGFPGDYHQGWYLSSTDDLHLRFETANVKDCGTLSMRFLIDERHRMYIPEKIEIIKEGAVSCTVDPHDSPKKNGIAKVDIRVNLHEAEYVEIKIYSGKLLPGSKIACDEIQLK